MRFIIDAVLIIVLLVIGGALQDYSEKLQGTIPIEERVKQFENDVANEEIIRDVYSIEKPYLKQIEENNAGKLADQASKFVVEFIDVTMNFTSEIIKQTWK